MLHGIGASQGIGIGKAVILEDPSLDFSAVQAKDPQEEKARLDAAVERFSAETAEMAAALKKSAGEKEAEILEGHLMPDHVHMLVSIPPKISAATFMGYLKEKSSLMMFDRHANLKYDFKIFDSAGEMRENPVF